MNANVPIYTFADILEAMARQPELEEAMRQRVLSQEIRQLPAVVAQLAAAVQSNTERLDRLEATVARLAESVREMLAVVTAVSERQNRMESDIAELKDGQAELKAGQARHEERLGRLEDGQAELKAGQARHEERLEGLEAGQAELKAGQARHEEQLGRLEEGQSELKAGQARHEEQLGRLEAGQARHEERLGRLEDGQAELKAGQVRHEERLGRLEDGQSRHEEWLADLKAGQARLEGRVGNISGTDYERRIARHARSIVNRRLGLKRPTTLQSINVTDNPELIAMLENAVASKVITDEQAYSLDLADLIVAARVAAGETAYVVAEVSETIADYDIDRARERSDVLAQASSGAVTATVIGREISDANRQRAKAGNVVVIIMTD